MRNALFVVLLTSLLPLGSRAVAVEPCTAKRAPSVIRVGILYRSDTIEGEQLLAGVEKILNEPAGNGTASLIRICTVRYPYPNEERGYRDLKNIRDKLAVDPVIGPTDSGVFAAAPREEETFARAGLPLVSPVVEANFAEQSDWLFKTNADVGARAETMLSLLRRRRVSSVGVLYEGTAFGLGAEKAFREFSGELDNVARETSSTPPRVAIAWLMAQPGITAPIAGATTLPQLEELFAATRLQLSAANLKQLDAASRQFTHELSSLTLPRKTGRI